MKKKICLIMLFTGIALVLSGFLPAFPHKNAPSSVADVAAAITADCDSTEEKSMAVYRYMTRCFQYNSELRDAILSKEVVQHATEPQQILNDRKGICCDLAVLYAAMLESQGIEVKIVKGYYNGVYHAWNSVYEEETGNWAQIDVTSDLWHGRSQTEWPEYDAARYTVSSNIDYSDLTPLTFGGGKESRDSKPSA